MKNVLILSVATLASTTLAVLSTFSRATAVDFGQQEIDQKKLIAIAVDHAAGTPQLVILEQVSNSQLCWKESGTSPVAVEALLLKFDFTGICKRSADVNNYSIRMAGQDLSLLYKLKVIKHENEFSLIGISNTDPNAPTINIGRTYGISSALTKIFLEPGWRFTKRSYNGQTLDHVYLTNDLPLQSARSQQQSGKSRPGLPPPVQAVDGTFQIFKSNLPSCKPGNYRVAGSFDSSFTTFTLTQAGGAEGCFSSVPAPIFTVPGLIDGGQPVKFESRVGAGGIRIAGSVSRVYGSVITPIIYPDTPKTYGILALNSQNTKIKGNSTIGVVNKIPGSPNDKAAKNFPELLPRAETDTEIMRDTRPNSITKGLEVVRNQLKVVFSPRVTVDEVNSALAAVGGAIISSSPGVTVITIQIPDTGDLDGLDRAEGILSGQPKVLTAVPVFIDEPPKPPVSQPPTSLALTSPSALTSPELIPMPLRLVGAVTLDRRRPAGLGREPVNLFMLDNFSKPVNDDISLIDRFTDRKRLEGELIYVAKLGDYFKYQYDDDTCTKEEFKREDRTKCQKHSHGYLVAGLMAAKTNLKGVMGMLPSPDARIAAFNAAFSNADDFVLKAMQANKGNHVLNLSQGFLSEFISESNANHYGIIWTLEIRQRQLENRAVIAASAGNASDRCYDKSPKDKCDVKIAKAEHNSRYAAAGLGTNVKAVLERRLRICQKTWFGLGPEECGSEWTDEIPRLSNTLVVENLDVTGEYANSSSAVTLNPRLAVRAIGTQSTPCPFDADGKSATVDKGFPFLTFDNKMGCIKEGGTSSAAPQVAGLAAWLWSRESYMAAPQVVQRIIDGQTKFRVLSNLPNVNSYLIFKDGAGNEVFQELDSSGKAVLNKGNPIFKDSTGKILAVSASSLKPKLSNNTAINVPKTLRVAGFSLTDDQPAPPSNRPPVANNDAATVSRYGSILIDVLANDTDPDGDSLTVTNLTPTPGSQGSIALDDGLILYSPSPSSSTSTDTFTYTISDGKGGTATATVTITIQ